MDRTRKIWWLRRETILGAVGIGLWVLSNVIMSNADSSLCLIINSIGRGSLGGSILRIVVF